MTRAEKSVGNRNASDLRARGAFAIHRSARTWLAKIHT